MLGFDVLSDNINEPMTIVPVVISLRQCISIEVIYSETFTVNIHTRAAAFPNYFRIMLVDI